MLSTLFFYGALAMTALRLALAAIFIVHGWVKLKDLKGTAAWFASAGMKPGGFWGALVALLEFVGGIALVFGAFVQPIAVLLALRSVTIISWKITKNMSFTGNGGWELDLIMLAALIVLVFLGGGSYSLDRTLLLGL